jgi:hypothetical protein
MHHAHAAQAGAVRQADELAQGLARLIHAQAVQIELALDAPLARAQPARHVRAHARAAKAQLVVHVQQGADVELVAQRFMQHARLVQLALHRQGLGRHGAGQWRSCWPLSGCTAPTASWNRWRSARALLGLAAQPFALGLLRGPLLQRAAQGLEVGKRLGFERGGHG